MIRRAPYILAGMLALSVLSACGHYYNARRTSDYLIRVIEENQQKREEGTLPEALPDIYTYEDFRA